MNRIFPYGHFCDPLGIPNQKICVSDPGIFFCISVPSRPPCVSLTSQVITQTHGLGIYSDIALFFYTFDLYHNCESGHK